MGGARGVTTTPTTPATPSTVPATPAPATPQLVNRGAGMSTLPVSPAGPAGFPSASNKGGGTPTVPSPTFASDPVVAQPLPTPIQSNKGGGVTSPLASIPASPFTGLASIPLSPYGSTGYTSPGPQVDVTELSRTNFDDELTARDTLRRLVDIEEKLSSQGSSIESLSARTTPEQFAREQELRRQREQSIGH